ncbi:hypothetical protein D3C87_1906360 [compost metagenome]
MPLGTKVNCLFISLASEFENVRMSLHRDDIWIYSELTKLKRERLQLCVGERLIREVNYRMPGPRFLHLS